MTRMTRDDTFPNPSRTKCHFPHRGSGDSFRGCGLSNGHNVSHVSQPSTLRANQQKMHEAAAEMLGPSADLGGPWLGGTFRGVTDRDRDKWSTA